MHWNLRKQLLVLVSQLIRSQLLVSLPVGNWFVQTANDHHTIGPCVVTSLATDDVVGHEVFMRSLVRHNPWFLSVRWPLYVISHGLSNASHARVSALYTHTRIVVAQQIPELLSLSNQMKLRSFKGQINMMKSFLLSDLSTCAPIIKIDTGGMLALGDLTQLFHTAQSKESAYRLFAAPNGNMPHGINTGLLVFGAKIFSFEHPHRSVWCALHARVLLIDGWRCGRYCSAACCEGVSYNLKTFNGGQCEPYISKLPPTLIVENRDSDTSYRTTTDAVLVDYIARKPWHLIEKDPSMYEYIWWREFARDRLIVVGESWETPAAQRMLGWVITAFDLRAQLVANTEATSQRYPRCWAPLGTSQPSTADSSLTVLDELLAVCTVVNGGQLSGVLAVGLTVTQRAALANSWKTYVGDHRGQAWPLDEDVRLLPGMNLIAMSSTYVDSNASTPVDSLMRPPSLAERSKLLAARRKRYRIVTRFDTLPATPEQINPRWHRPVHGTTLRVGRPTTVVWTLDSTPPSKVLFRARMSIESVVRVRNKARPLRLVLVVLERGRIGQQQSSDSAPDLCAALVPTWRHVRRSEYALANGDRECRSLRSVKAYGGCALNFTYGSNHANTVALTIVHAGGEWALQPDLVSLCANWISYSSGGRSDLVGAAPAVLSRFLVAPQLLLSLGVDRFVYLDADTCALTQLDELYETPLSPRYPIAFVRRQRHDDVYTREYYNLSNPLMQQYGFYNDDAQAINNGVFVIDSSRMCMLRGISRMVQLARDLVNGNSTLFSHTAPFDQAISAIALAQITTYADPRWNCRRPWRAFVKCFIVHTYNCAAGIRSGLPGASWLTDARFFKVNP